MGRTSYARDPKPDQVAGFEAARRLGLTPTTPSNPPELVCRPSYGPVLPAALLALGAIASLVVHPSGVTVGICVGAVIAVGWVIVVMQRRERLEVTAGYRLVEWRAGTWGRDPDGRFRSSTGIAAAPWDLRGLWHLDSKGRVLGAPDPTVLPPGKYPSPNHPGELELWTGAAWMYGYETPVRPFLGTS